MANQITPFGLRLPPETKAALERSARDAGRSLNAEIVLRLEASLSQESEMEDLKNKVVEVNQKAWEAIESAERARAAEEALRRNLESRLDRALAVMEGMAQDAVSLGARVAALENARK
jgi:hypothetical protein